MYYETILAPPIELPQEMPSLMKEGTVPIPKETWYFKGTAMYSFTILHLTQVGKGHC